MFPLSSVSSLKFPGREADRESLNKSRFCDAVENVVLADTASTLNGGDESDETADVRGFGVAEQREEDAA